MSIPHICVVEMSSEDFLKKKEAVKLLLEGKSVREVSRTVGLSGLIVGGLYRQLSSNRDAVLRKYGLKPSKPEAKPSSGRTSLGDEDIIRRIASEVESRLRESMLKSGVEKLPNVITVREVKGEGGEAQRMVEREVTVDWSEVMQKSPITPTVYMWYVYSRSKGYTGSLRDFLDEVVNEYFEKVKGLKIGVIGEVS